MKKNILLITSDQHNYSLMGYNHSQLKTPNLDRLAAQGMIFDRAYCPNPTCTPSRASIISGMYPSQHGAWALGTKLPEDVHVVGDDFKAAGTRTDAMISLVDLAPTFLDFAEIPVPRCMTGKSQKQVLEGKAAQARDRIIVENHHQPTTLHLKTYMDARYKLTVYYNQEYGELFDLKEDPAEVNNLWNDPSSQQLKQELMLKYIHAELGKEPMWMPGISTA